MNNIRIFLYVALGILCLMLWNTWQKDYPEVVTKAEVAKTMVADSNPASNVALDTVSASNGNTNLDVAKTEPLEKVAAPASRLVAVHTDVLDVLIDTLGGNVVSAKLLKYPVSLQEKNVPVQLLNDDPDKFYVASSALIGLNGPDANPTKPALYSAAQKNYVLSEKQNDVQVKLNWQGKTGLNVTKIFTFTRGHYDIKVGYDIVNQGASPWQGKFIAKLERKNLAEDKSSGLLGGMFNFRTFTGAAISSPETPCEKLSFNSLAKENLSRTIVGGWLAMEQRYFLSVWIPNQNKTYNYFSQVLDDQIYTLGLADNVVVAPNSATNVSANLYIGPKITKILKALAPHLDLTIDYGWLWIISVAIFWVMQQLYSLVGNWGWSIILVTVLIKLAFYKLSETSYRSMAKMRHLAPKFQALKERYGDDRQKMSQATMEMYKKEKVNPLGGCLPILVQIPVFIALYYVLIAAVELRQAPFIFWIQDLSVKDPYFVLPILMGLSMFAQNRLNPPSPDPAQAKMMMFLPVIFTLFFLSFPAGLVLYWLVNNCLSLAQQWYITWKLEKTLAHKKTA